VIGLILNIIAGIALILWGSMILNESPSTSSFMDRIQKAANSMMGCEYCIPFYIVGILFVLLGLCALFVAFMLFAQEHGFWII
jgi:uncharacterized protein YqgC (DUF456 family)